MKKKSKLPRLLFALVVLLGAAMAVAVYVAPDRAREAWRSVQAKLDALSTVPAEPDARPESLRPAPPQSTSVPARLEKPAPAAVGGKAVVQPASARKVTAAKATEPASAGAEGPAGAEAKAGAIKSEPSGAPARATAALAEGSFEFPADESGRLLAERLTPPRQLPLAPAPYVREPQPRPAGMPDDLRPHVAKLPPVVSGPATVVVGDERRTPQRRQAAMDRPPLAAEADPARPQRPLWPAAPLAYTPSANPDVAPALRYVGLPVAEAVTPQDDPSADVSRKALLSGTSIPAPAPPPFLRLTIPDPFETARVVQLANPPAERDPPEPSFQRPQPPPLPMPEPAKKK